MLVKQLHSPAAVFTVATTPLPVDEAPPHAPARRARPHARIHTPVPFHLNAIESSFSHHVPPSVLFPQCELQPSFRKSSIFKIQSSHCYSPKVRYKYFLTNVWSKNRTILFAKNTFNSIINAVRNRK